jgi:hypothetical protein
MTLQQTGLYWKQTIHSDLQLLEKCTLIQSLVIEPKSSGSSVCGGVNVSNKHYSTTGSGGCGMRDKGGLKQQRC